MGLDRFHLLPKSEHNAKPTGLLAKGGDLVACRSAVIPFNRDKRGTYYLRP